MPQREEDFPFTPEFELLLLGAKEGLIRAAEEGRVMADTFPAGSLAAARKFLIMIQEDPEYPNPSEDFRAFCLLYVSFLEKCEQPCILGSDECDCAQMLAFDLEIFVTIIELVERQYRKRLRKS